MNYQTSSGLSGLTNASGEFEYNSRDRVTFSIGDVQLGSVTGASVLTPVEVTGARKTSDRRVINMVRFLQTLDDDGDPSNGLEIKTITRNQFKGRSLNFNQSVANFETNAGFSVRIATGRGLVDSSQAINHLHNSLVVRGKASVIATTSEIRNQIPEYSLDAASGVTTTISDQPCQFNGTPSASGNSVIAYQSATVPFGQNCSSQTRTCSNGKLSGSFTNSSCQVQAAADCNLGGLNIANGTSVTAYKNATANFGGICESQTRSCNNGSLSGNFEFSSCQVSTANACAFGDTILEHGTGVITYAESSVPAGSLCRTELRSCENGILSGSFQFESCRTEESLSGTQSQCTFDGKLVDHGVTVVGYASTSVPFGSTCRTELRTCNNGSLSGSFSNSSCGVAAAASCTLGGQEIEHGLSLTTYLSASVSFGSTCSSQSRTCNNGVLSGTYNFGSCAVAAPEPEPAPSTCILNGQTIAQGGAIQAYQSSTVPYGTTCSEQTRTCSDGSLSGSYTYSSCSVSQASSCTLNGQTIDHNQSVTAYQASTVDFGSTCSSQSRTCNNGVLSGTYGFSSCSENDPVSCTFNGLSVLHGGMVTAYETDSVSYGGICNSEMRTCSNGVLHGTFSNLICSVNTKWSQQHGTSSADYARGIATDSSGNVYVTGITSGAFGGGNVGSYDLILVKYNSAGVKQWTKQHGTSSWDEARGIATDSSGNVYVTGFTGGALDGSNAGSNDLFLVKYDSAGDRKWTKQLGTPSNDIAYGIATDSNGNVYVTGFTSGNLDGNTNAGGADLFVVKYNSSGVKQWTRQLGTHRVDVAFDISTDSSGNVYVTGYTYGWLDGQRNAGGADLFVVKYNSSGVKQWTRQLGTTSGDWARGIRTDSSGNVYVTGHTSGSFDGNTNAGVADLFLVKYDSAGDRKWTKQLGTYEMDEAFDISTDSSGNVYVTGYTSGSFDGNTNAGGADLFLVKYDSAGDRKWTKQLGTPSTDKPQSIATDSDGNVYVTGYTHGGLDGNTNAGSVDLFVVKYDSNGNLQ